MTITLCRFYQLAPQLHEHFPCDWTTAAFEHKLFRTTYIDTFYSQCPHVFSRGSEDYLYD